MREFQVYAVVNGALGAFLVLALLVFREPPMPALPSVALSLIVSIGMSLIVLGKSGRPRSNRQEASDEQEARGLD